MAGSDPLGARRLLATAGGPCSYYRLRSLTEAGLADVEALPVTVKVLLENLLRRAGSGEVSEDDVVRLARWGTEARRDESIPFLPARILLQDHSGVPALIDIAALRAAVAAAGGEAASVDLVIPADLVVDHSVQVDVTGPRRAVARNVELEYERNSERYSFLRWAQQAFAGLRVVPPGHGIVHQVNLERLATVVTTVEDAGTRLALPDTVVGTDSHTPMVNGLGVLGWGVGGIEAEAALLGQPLPVPVPEVVGVELVGELRPGTTTTDLVLTVTEALREVGVVGAFVELCGPGTAALRVPDRATLSNMAPEFGATAALVPVDEHTLAYLAATRHDDGLVDLVERYTKEQGLYGCDVEVARHYSRVVRIDLGEVETSVAGPRRPHERQALADVPRSFASVRSNGDRNGRDHGERLEDGAVVIAAIASCTNTSNPSVMFGAGLLAKKAVERGLEAKPWVKTSLTPGSRVVTRYLRAAGLDAYLSRLGFDVAGYGCATCIGNSGPLAEPVAQAIAEQDLAVAAVLSGNRNLEGRIHPQVRASYLASPLLVVAYAIAGTVLSDLDSEPLGTDEEGRPVYLEELWPRPDEIAELLTGLSPRQFEAEYAHVFEGDERWRALPLSSGALYQWDPDSTYVREPPFFDPDAQPSAPADIHDARVLVYGGDTVTTDHISPAGAIAPGSPAARYLEERGVARRDFNTYGCRRGNHELMAAGTFANVRLRNRLLPESEGGVTVHLESGEEGSVHDVAMRYLRDGVPLLVLAGKEYGFGSSRDWAAKGCRLLGVRAVLAESFERIHRSNLVAVGVLPLELPSGESADSLGLTGRESFDVVGTSDLTPRARLTVRARGTSGVVEFPVTCRADSWTEVEYLRHGGVLPLVLRRRLSEEGASCTAI